VLAGVRRSLTVTLILRLAEDGSVVAATVETSSGHPGFDEHARAWVLARWRFEAPGRAVRTRVPVHYRP
jgi:TonB family protein